MPRFSAMLVDGMKRRGHQVHVYFPKPYFFKLPAPAGFKKWLGYVDQYVVFPLRLRKKFNRKQKALLVFTDHALGPWISLAENKPHVIHCHDFLAQRSALGEIAENPTGITGRLYQSYIRRGYRKGKNFISVSENTRNDLHRFLQATPLLSEVVYNGFNQPFAPACPEQVRHSLTVKTGIQLSEGYILHVGGNQWYKNRVGVVDLYSAWRGQSAKKLPLLLVGAAPNPALKDAVQRSTYRSSIYFLTSMDDGFVQMAYAGASLLLFPSLAEGFGWPIAEAMASGCPVITTGEPPMSEVAGMSGFLLARMPIKDHEKGMWLKDGAELIESVINLPVKKHREVVEEGLQNAERFDTEQALDQIEMIYKKVLSDFEEFRH